MFTKFQLFLEKARLSDSIKNIKKINWVDDIINNEFNNDSELLSYIYITGTTYNKRIDLNWNDRIHHSIIKRIKDRSSIKSISEFNEIIDYTLTILIKDHIDDLMTNDEAVQTIAVKIPDIQLYLIIRYYPNTLFHDKTYFIIKTIDTSFKEEKIDQSFNIEYIW